MTEINIPPREQQALDEVDPHTVHALATEAVLMRSMSGLRDLPLWSCGPHVANHLRRFEQALADCRNAKSAKKLTETKVRASRAGTELYYAVREMKERLETERREAQLFKIEDYVLAPHRFRPDLAVRISYQWRRTADEDWTFGDIVFEHEVDVSQPIGSPPPKRKPSAAKREDELEQKLYREWDHLKSLGLWSLQAFFRSGGDGAAIPKRFVAKVDPRIRGLDNFSADFWRERG